MIISFFQEMLKEIVLVDDGSTHEEITKTLPLYIKYRLNGNHPKVKLRVLPKQTGLIGARLAGAEWSTSDIIVFLDAHCEATIGWLEPLAQRIKDHPKTVVIPSIDGIDDRTLAFHGSAVSTIDNKNRYFSTTYPVQVLFSLLLFSWTQARIIICSPFNSIKDLLGIVDLV